MSDRLKKIWNAVTTVLVVIVVLCAVFLMGSRLLGFEVYTVLSGSMEPTYKTGDLLYVKKVDVDSIKVGDPITFVLNEDLVVATHRVVRIDAENERFYTKGDANEIEDNDPVHFKNVLGVPQFSLPKLGYVSNYVQNPPGMYITIAAGAILILLVFLPDLVGNKSAKKKDEEEAEGEEKPEASTEDQPETDAAIAENERLKAEIEQLKAEVADKKDEGVASGSTDQGDRV
ncbi:MAG: signal peptidase I [Clostridia bacterium]|nr:signal peptidase I [Clostridia bacterium]